MCAPSLLKVERCLRTMFDEATDYGCLRFIGVFGSAREVEVEGELGRTLFRVARRREI